jgi:D-aminoacyl-tRNA deacylase
MRAILQRVISASVTVDEKTIAAIGQGLLILLGVGPDDSGENALAMAKKIAALRIFSDSEGKMNLSVRDIQGSALVVSQFTLFGDTSRGNRPSFIGAAKPEIAQPLCDRFCENLTQEGVPTQSGEFGAHMQVHLVNDGPVTISIEM